MDADSDEKDYFDANPENFNRKDGDSPSADEDLPSSDALDSPTDPDAKEYSMSGAKRGMVIIFNQINFDDSKAFPMREGTDVDVANLRSNLQLLGFRNKDIKEYRDFKYENVKDTLQKLRYDKELKQTDCIMVVLLTHGLSNDLVMAKDKPYSLDLLFDYFTPQSLPAMAGKPKIFIIQACRGGLHDDGVSMLTKATQEGLDVDLVDSQRSYTLPTYTDLIVMRSCYEGYVSYRNNIRGSWMIRSFCKAIRESDLQTTSLESILIDTKLYVSMMKSKGDNLDKKQAAAVYSTAIRKVFFRSSK